MKQIDVLYFAWVRERIGQPKEKISTEAETVAALVGELCARGPEYRTAFSDLGAVRVAVDQEIAALDSSIADAAEVAFFPPMTGG